MRHPVRPVLVVATTATLLALAGPRAAAQSDAKLLDRPGKVEVKVVDLRHVAENLALKTAELATVRAKLAELQKAIRGHAIFNPARGYEATIRGSLASPYDCKTMPCPRSRVSHQVHVKLEHYCTANGRIITRCGTSRGFTITANELDNVGEAADGELRDDQGRQILKEPRLVKTFAGVPFYEHGLMLITRTKRPFYLPVSREQYLRAQLRKLDQSEYRGTPQMKELRGRLQAELDRMTPEQRRSDAWMGGETTNLSGLNAPNAEGAWRLVILNPAFLDPKLPRTAIQFFRVTYAFLYGGEAAYTRPLTLADEHVRASDIRMGEFLRTFDWQKLVQLVDAR